MTTRTLLMSLPLLALPALASADCLVEYKAKQDDPLRLDHGTIQLPACNSPEQVEADTRAELATRGWILLKVVSTTDAN
ncbi:hypothetical protein J5474_07110 [Sagittula sp. M10.9X]|uniref:Uncharacterized protein n=2 Tax=Sagittula salina TaxID=2820268 RepID=A0A940MMX5_9RHOB|nr:hypothetical protein [Sagittula salina]